MPSHFSWVALRRRFKGVLLGWDARDYFVFPFPETELASYDTSVVATSAYDVRNSLRIPHTHFLDVGKPEVQIFSALPFGVYGAFAVPVAYACLQVLCDGQEIDPAQQRSVLPDYLFAAASTSSTSSDSGAPPDGERTGLVRSRLSLVVDGAAVAVWVPRSQLR